jgi:hypothetical protein
MTNPLISCPGCGEKTHRRATVCPHCGCPAELTVFQEQLASLSTICSILVGFALAGLVQLSGDVEKIRESRWLLVAVGCWLFSSLVLLAVLVLAELLRRQEVADAVLDLPDDKLDDYQRRCERLLTWFAVALVITFIGVVLLGFHFSLWHGLVTLLAVALVVVIVYRVMSPTR